MHTRSGLPLTPPPGSALDRDSTTGMRLLGHTHYGYCPRLLVVAGEASSPAVGSNRRGMITPWERNSKGLYIPGIRRDS